MYDPTQLELTTFFKKEKKMDEAFILRSSEGNRYLSKFDFRLCIPYDLGAQSPWTFPGLLFPSYYTLLSLGHFDSRLPEKEKGKRKGKAHVVGFQCGFLRLSNIHH